MERHRTSCKYGTDCNRQNCEFKHNKKKIISNIDFKSEFEKQHELVKITFC